MFDIIIVVNGRIIAKYSSWEMKHMDLVGSYLRKEMINYRGQPYWIRLIEFHDQLKADIIYLESHAPVQVYQHHSYEWVGG